eukprot:16802-Heterococcus_DN1.PRE.3
MKSAVYSVSRYSISHNAPDAYHRKSRIMSRYADAYLTAVSIITAVRELKSTCIMLHDSMVNLLVPQACPCFERQ